MKTEKLYTLTELETIIGVTHRTLQEYVKLQKIRARKICGKWRVTETDLQAFLTGSQSNQKTV